MSIENSFCRCDWDNTVELWTSSNSEDDFAASFFSAESTEEIEFPDKVHYHLASWDLLEDFSDWYRGREFGKSVDWDHFCAAWKQLGLMETKEFLFEPVNELADTETTEVVFGALSPGSVRSVLTHLGKIDSGGLDNFFGEHGMAITVPFSELVSAVKEALDPEKGLVIFAG